MKCTNSFKNGGAVALTAMWLACGGGSGGLAPGDGSNGGTNNATGGTTNDGTGNTASNGSGSAGSTSGGGSTTGGDPMRENPTDVVPEVVVEVSGPPDGCENSASATVLTLTLSTAIPLADLEVREGAVYVNDTACVTDGSPIEIAALQKIEVIGGDANEAVLLDMSSGDWSGLLATEGSLEMNLAGGNNSVMLTTDSTDQAILHGMLEEEPVVDLTGDTVINLLADGASRIGLNMGAGNDTVGDLTAALTAASENPAEYELPTELETLLPLSVSLLAFGGDGDDVILGGSGNDQLGGGLGDDILSGLAGTDQFTGSPEMDGTDIINGGPDYDVSSYATREVDLVLKLCVSEQLIGCTAGQCDCETSGQADELDLIVNIEEVFAGSGDDVLIGTAEAETLRGGAGDDEIHGGPGPDVLQGQRGLDILDGGEDEDICDQQPSESPISCEI